MKLHYKGSDAMLDVKKYPTMPLKFVAVGISINDEPVDARLCGGKVPKTGEQRDYTYITYRNVVFFVPGHLKEGDELELEVPDDWGNPEPPPIRQSEYKKKAPALDAEGNPIPKAVKAPREPKAPKASSPKEPQVSEDSLIASTVSSPAEGVESSGEASEPTPEGVASPPVESTPSEAPRSRRRASTQPAT